MPSESAADLAPLTLEVPGRLRRPLAELERALAERTGEPKLRITRGTSPGEPTLALDVHPAAPPFEIHTDGEAAGASVRFSAPTATAGPGLHAFATELARALEPHVDWDWAAARDPSGYAQRGDAAALEAYAARWLASLAREALSMIDGGAASLAMLLPADVVFQAPADVLTPLGPRDRAWLERVAADGRAGDDALAWWSPGVGARYHRDRALVRMWLELPWRRPIDDEEREALEEIVTALGVAEGLDPELPMPWAAWSELFELLGEDSLRATKVHLRARSVPDAEPIGYRRRDVRVELPAGWSIRVPGSLRTRFAEHGTFCAWDAGRTYWVTTISAAQAHTTAETLADLKEPDGDGEALAFEKGRIEGRGRFGVAEDGWHVLRAQAAVGGQAALGTLLFAREDERDEALSVWGSLEHSDG